MTGGSRQFDQIVKLKSPNIMNKTRKFKKNFLPQTTKAAQKTMFCSEPYKLGQLKPRKLKMPISKIFENKPTSIIKEARNEVNVKNLFRNSMQF